MPFLADKTSDKSNDMTVDWDVDFDDIFDEILVVDPIPLADVVDKDQVLTSEQIGQLYDNCKHVENKGPAIGHQTTIVETPDGRYYRIKHFECLTESKFDEQPVRVVKKEKTIIVKVFVNADSDNEKGNC